jgi:hypothetical protein
VEIALEELGTSTVVVGPNRFNWAVGADNTLGLMSAPEE